jgi:hypothetical protein
MGYFSDEGYAMRRKKALKNWEDSEEERLNKSNDMEKEKPESTDAPEVVAKKEETPAKKEEEKKKSVGQKIAGALAAGMRGYLNAGRK